MSYKNPYIKSGNEKTYTVPEYTPDNYFAQRDWNKEIANNKQGYMAVDIMSMKDFYDAGGYSFVDDYRAELTDIDAAYDRALPGYGVRGEQMARAGLGGSGYSDYLGGQAYAGRVAGQALARQNAMANSNSFRAAYNQYVAQQKEKREANLQTVVDRAISVNMNPKNFVTIATRLGIPQADAERGLEQLIAYYQGLGKLPTENADGSTTGTSGNTAPVWGNTNQYGVTDDQMSDVKSIQASLQGGLTGYTDNDGNVIVPQAPTLDAQIAALYGGTISKDDPRIQAAIKLAQESEVQGVIGTAQRGNFAEAKAKLDAWKDYGLFGEEGEKSAVYQNALKQVQAEAGKAIAATVKQGTLESYTNALTTLGYKDEEITEENAPTLFYEALEEAHKEGVVNDETYHAIYAGDYDDNIREVTRKREATEYINSFANDIEKIGEKASEIAKKIDINGNIYQENIEITINGKTYAYDYETTADMEEIPVLDGVKDGELIIYNGKTCVYIKGRKNDMIKEIRTFPAKLPRETINRILKAKGKIYDTRKFSEGIGSET